MPTTMFRQCEDGKALRDVFLEPSSQLSSCTAVVRRQAGECFFDLGEAGSVSDLAQLGADALADGKVVLNAETQKLATQREPEPLIPCPRLLAWQYAAPS